MTTAHPTRLAVLGLGQLGTALAQAFLDGGHELAVWNRTPARADALIERGARRAESVVDAVGSAELIVTVVSDYAAAEQLLAPAADELRGRTIANLISGTPEQARALARWADERGIGYLDGAAMSGTTLIGKPEALFIFSGSEETFAAHRSTLSALGNAVHLGSDAGLAAMYDTALLGLIWGSLSGFYHGAALLGTEQVAARTFAKVAVGHLSFIARLFAEHAGQLDRGEFSDADGTIEVHVEAVNHLLETSRRQGIDTAVPELFAQLLQRGIASGRGDSGVAAVAESIRSGV
ncbi:NAD(P)-binding domain-containing protein [Nocardia sp. CDC159]|uniref:NAD(P)-binding domain-containing protein n=1 Tax=Nocardia pulmonis TaxID=2951408 RepID=A0A9X2EBY9_9NOCA|nr:MULTISPECIES: NAD(P)-binding domain-containing protein [Nocardia]MCM6777546.1 NAD(P)-binding domain-containing protein [Nocardia pulmonis]MCM6790347.1 NAD(P)-binding domain-containing protein [Nocardia sp. CDC159]